MERADRRDGRHLREQHRGNGVSVLPDGRDGTAASTRRKSNYTLTFGPGQLPPVNAFWSVTMYDANTKFLVDNPLGRYLINSPMLASLEEGRRTAASRSTCSIRSPGPTLEPNWLPAPDGPMSVVMRLYLPKPEVITARWKPPPIRTAGPATP